MDKAEGSVSERNFNAPSEHGSISDPSAGDSETRAIGVFRSVPSEKTGSKMVRGNSNAMESASGQLPSSRPLSRTYTKGRKQSFVARIPSVGFHPLGSRGRRWRLARPGQTFPFIARLSRAYLNFEVKDAPKARGLRPSLILEFKFQIRFSAAMR